MRLAIIGSRTFDDLTLMTTVIRGFLNSKHRIDMLVSGGARGADSLAEMVAKELDIPINVYEVTPEDWSKYGKSAGHRRNIKIEENSDAVLAFCSGKFGSTPGTKNCVLLFVQHNKPVVIVEDLGSNAPSIYKYAINPV